VVVVAVWEAAVAVPEGEGVIVAVDFLLEPESVTTLPEDV
jgi:hypothetical protein